MSAHRFLDAALRNESTGGRTLTVPVATIRLRGSTTDWTLPVEPRGFALLAGRNVVIAKARDRLLLLPLSAVRLDSRADLPRLPRWWRTLRAPPCCTSAWQPLLTTRVHLTSASETASLGTLIALQGRDRPYYLPGVVLGQVPGTRPAAREVVVELPALPMLWDVADLVHCRGVLPAHELELSAMSPANTSLVAAERAVLVPFTPIPGIAFVDPLPMDGGERSAA